MGIIIRIPDTTFTAPGLQTLSVKDDAFYRAQILSVAAPLGWWRADQYNAATGTCLDLSGNGQSATQSTSGYRPTKALDGIGGRAAMIFDGTDDRLVCPSIMPVNADYAWFLVFASDEAGAGVDYPVGGNNASSNQWGININFNQTGKVYLYHDAGTIVVSANIGDAGAVALLMSFDDSALEANARAAGVAYAGVSIANHNDEPTLLIGAQRGANLFQGQIAEAMLIGSDAYNNAAIVALLQEYAAARYGLTL